MCNTKGVNTNRTRKTLKPETRLGGQITFREQTFETMAELEQAIAGAVAEAGWKLTPAGAAYLEGLRDGQRREASLR